MREKLGDVLMDLGLHYLPSMARHRLLRKFAIFWLAKCISRVVKRQLSLYEQIISKDSVLKRFPGVQALMASMALMPIAIIFHGFGIDIKNVGGTNNVKQHRPTENG